MIKEQLEKSRKEWKKKEQEMIFTVLDICSDEAYYPGIEGINKNSDDQNSDDERN